MAHVKAIGGESIGGTPRRSRVYRAGRVCARQGCDTRLSMYNRKNTCSIHTPMEKIRVRGRKPALGTTG
jgi:hypothetical protein